MDDTITLTFDDDPNDVDGIIYINRKVFTEYTESMNHTQVDEFNRHLDLLIEASNRAELAQYAFLSFTKPADYDRKKYSIEPLGQEHAEWRSDNEEAKTQTAVSSAKHHFYLMSLCGRPEGIEKLHCELTLSDQELCKLRQITDPARVGAVRVGIAKTIRQVERMLKQYSVQEIAEANAFLDDVDE
jgi:hypothetical protein